MRSREFKVTVIQDEGNGIHFVKVISTYVHPEFGEGQELIYYKDSRDKKEIDEQYLKLIKYYTPRKEQYLLSHLSN